MHVGSGHRSSSKAVVDFNSFSLNSFLYKLSFVALLNSLALRWWGVRKKRKIKIVFKFKMNFKTKWLKSDREILNNPRAWLKNGKKDSYLFIIVYVSQNWCGRNKGKTYFVHFIMIIFVVYMSYKTSNVGITSNDIIAGNGRVLKLYLFIVWLYLFKKYI